MAEAVDAFPQLTRAFERLGLDYCCGGQRTISEACAAAGLDPLATIAELAVDEPADVDGASWVSMTASELVDHLEATHHRYLWDEMPRVTALVDKIVAVHGERHPELVPIAACVARVFADLGPHMMKEERVLFPMIREARRVVGVTGVPLRDVAEPDLGDVERTRRSRRVARRAAARDRRLHTAGGWVRDVCGVLRGARRDRSRHASAHPQGEQRVVPAGRAPGSGTGGGGACSMSDTAHRVACDEGGDPPCWSHLVEQAEFDASRPDLADRAGIERMVRDFYRDAAMDDVLGPVFHAARVDWSAHIATLVDFWSWQLLGDPGYAGHPLRAHEPVHARTPLTSVHYERWVSLFHSTIDASFEGPRADAAKQRGSKMAAAMARLISGVSARGAEPIEPVWRAAGGRRGGPSHDGRRWI